MSRRWSDKLEIQELKHRYCYTTDRLDSDAIRELVTEDCRIDIPLREPIEGREELRSYFEWFGEQAYTVRSHNVVNPIVAVGDDRATGQWYYVVIYALPNGNLEVGHGRYEDEFERVDDEWKIASVKGVRRITREVPANEV